jgi:ubiquinol-cytochrome c reductase cytochrome b subunit
MPSITFNVMMAWPWIEAKFTGDRLEHHILDHPSARPVRTAIGAAVLAFYFVLFGASATDVLANYLAISLNSVLLIFRVLCVVVPLIVYPVTYKICKEMSKTKGAGRRKTYNIVVRGEDGGYKAVPAQEYAGYERKVLAPIDVDTVDLSDAMNPPLVTTNEGVYQIPRD